MMVEIIFMDFRGPPMIMSRLSKDRYRHVLEILVVHLRNEVVDFLQVLGS